MSYGTDHCSKVCICSSKEVKRNRDAIVEHTEENQTWQSYIRIGWRARRDLNPQPSDPKSDALSS
jgi:hypothetical protein